jgi:hypothetical protein
MARVSRGSTLRILHHTNLRVRTAETTLTSTGRVRVAPRLPLELETREWCLNTVHHLKPTLEE